MCVCVCDVHIIMVYNDNDDNNNDDNNHHHHWFFPFHDDVWLCYHGGCHHW